MLFVVLSAAATGDDETATVEDDIGKSRDASRTDDEVVERYGSCCHPNHQSAVVVRIVQVVQCPESTVPQVPTCGN